MILEGIVVAVVVSAGALALRFKIEGARQWSRQWQEAARERGLTDVTEHTALGMPTGLTGRKGALAVQLSTSVDFIGRADATYVRVGGLPTEFSLGRPPVSFLGEVLPSRGVATGDAEFDAVIEVSGDALVVRAVFDARTRRLARDLLGVRIQTATDDASRWPPAEMRNGVLALAHLDGSIAWGTPVRSAYLRDVFDLAERLVVPDGLEQRVAAVAAGDPLPEVRLAALGDLVEERPRHPATRAALLRALEDEDERVQLAAAMALGSEGRAVLVEIVGREWSGDACAARAVAELRAHLPAADVERALGHALRRGKEATIAACLESLARRGAAHLGAVGRVLAVEKGARAVAAARALGLAAGATAEGPLLRALGHADSSVRAAAAASLGRVGTAAAVTALREAEGVHARDDVFVRAARAAIASIQARLVGAGQGQLALAADGGEVSLADGVDGRVSLKDAP